MNECLSVNEIHVKAAEIRTDILRMLRDAGSGHPGGSLSAADIMAVLYFGGILHYDPLQPDWPGRDRFILSKGHAAPVLYATLAHAGYLSTDELSTLRQFGSRLQGHPDMYKCPGVEVSTGSLGQGLSIACGLAYALDTEDSEARVFTLLGDGECQEGQVWEAAMFAAHYHLGRLTAIVDVNELQIDGPTKEVMDLGDLAQKFAAFGWRVSVVDGHDVDALLEVLSPVPDLAETELRPHVVIARTVKGKGVSFMEGQSGWHGKAPNVEQCAAAIAELAPFCGPSTDEGGLR